MKFALTLALALLATPTRAEIMPQPGPGDPHIQSVAWDPQQVVGLRVGAGYAVTVVFAPDERIETVTLGDSAGWQVTADHAADRLVVKSIGRPPPTNLTVLSEARVYNFTLYAAEAGDGTQPYLVSFLYPTPAVAPAAPAAPAQWHLHGARPLWPASITDDGTHTTLRWPADAPIPAVYAVTDGASQLVNGTMRDGAYVIEAVPPRLEFVRAGHHAHADRIAP